MTDFRTVLDEQIGELPPSTVDISAIVAAQRRAWVLRRVAGGTAVAGAATAVAVAASVLPGGSAPATPPSGRPAPAPACSGPAPTTVTPSPWIDPGALPTASPVHSDLPGNAGPALTAALREAADPEIRGLRLGPYDDEGVSREPLVFFGGPCAARDREHYLAVASVSSRSGPIRGWFSVSVGTRKDTACRVPEDRCTVERVAGGAVVRVRTDRGDLQGRQAIRVIVVIDKPDGTVVDLVADGPLHGQPVLSVAALKRIGLDPGLTLDL